MNMSIRITTRSSMSMFPVPPIFWFPHLRIPEGTLVLQTRFMGLILHMHKRWQLQNPLDPISQFISNLPIIRPIPNTDNILTVSDGNHRSANFVSGDSRELTPNQCQHDFFPVSGCQTFSKPNDPFPSAGIDRILPSRFDALSEEMVIGGGG
jgi:hypothetical protein